MDVSVIVLFLIYYNISFEICSLWHFTQRRVVVSCRRFGTAYRVPSSWVKKCKSSCTPWSLRVGTIGCPEMSIGKYDCMLRRIQKERMSLLHAAEA